MHARKSTLKTAVIAAANLFFVALMLQSASLVHRGPGLKAGSAMPENSVVYDGRLLDYSYEVQGTRIEVRASGRVDVYLVQTPSTVLANAAVDFEAPFLGLEGSFTETSPGVYSFEPGAEAVLSVDAAAQGIDSFRGELTDWALNGKQVYQLSFADYVENAELGAAADPKVYEIPFHVAFEGRIFDGSGRPADGVRFAVEIPEYGFNETVTTDAQGWIRYEREEVLRLNVHGGELVARAEALAVPAASPIAFVAAWPGDDGGGGDENLCVTANTSKDRYTVGEEVRIQGQVTDCEGNTVSGASVSVRSTGPDSVVALDTTVSSRADGGYDVSHRAEPPGGEYQVEVEASHDGDSASASASYTISTGVTVELDLTDQRSTRSVPTSTPLEYRIYQRGSDRVGTEIVIRPETPLTDPADYLLEVGLYEADAAGEIDNESPVDSVERTVEVVGGEVTVDPPIVFELPDSLAVGYYQAKATVTLASGDGSQTDDDGKDLAVIFNPEAGLAATFVESGVAQVWLNGPDAFPYALNQSDGRLFKFAMDSCDGLTDRAAAIDALVDRTQFLVRWVPSPELTLDTLSGLAGCDVDDTANPANNDCYFGGRGQCFHYGDLMASFLRTMGIPGRPVSGGIPPASDPGNDIDWRVGAQDTDEAPGGTASTCWNYHVWTEAHASGSWGVYDANQDFLGTRARYGSEWIDGYCVPPQRSDGLITEGLADEECFDGAYGAAACPTGLASALLAAGSGPASADAKASDAGGSLRVEFVAERLHFGQDLEIEVELTNTTEAAWDGELSISLSGNPIAHPLAASKMSFETVFEHQETLQLEAGASTVERYTVTAAEYSAVGTGSYLLQAQAMGLEARDHRTVEGAVAINVVAPDRVALGAPVTVRAELSNPTPLDLEGVRVRGTNPQMGEQVVGSLAAGASTSLTWTFTPERAGLAGATVMAETDNGGVSVGRANVRVEAPASLRVYRLRLPQRVEVGESFEVAADLWNPGQIPLTGVRVELFAETPDLVIIDQPAAAELPALAAESIETVVWTATAQAPGRLRLRAAATAGPLADERSGTVVSADPGHDVDLIIEETGDDAFGGTIRTEVPTGSGSNSTGAGFEVRIQNDGSRSDTLVVSVVPDRNGVASFEDGEDRWIQRELTLGAGEEIRLNLQMRTWSEASSCRVTVRSQGDLTRWDRMTVQIRRNDASALQVEPDRLDFTIDHGGSATGTFDVSNRGDETLTGISLSAHGDIASWITLGSTSIAELAPGQTVAVGVTVTVPRYQAPETYGGSVRVQAGESSDAVAINVEVPESHEVALGLAPDSQSVVPGNTGVYGVEVRNEGNVSDTYDLELTGLPDDWEISWSRDSVLLEPGALADVDLLVVPLRSPHTAPLWHGLTVTATNEHASDRVDGELEVLVFHDVDLSVEDTEVTPGPPIIVDKVWKKAHDRPHGQLDVIIRTHGEATEENARTLEAHGASVKRRFRVVDGLAARIPAVRLTEIAAEPFVARIELDEEVTAFQQGAPAAGLESLNLDGLYSEGYSGHGVVVAILDTGIDLDHPALPNLTDGYDFVEDDAVPEDDHGHGTHVAGIVGSQDGDHPGVAPAATLMPVKVLNAAGAGWTSDVIAGVEWAVEQGAAVLNLSLGTSGSGDGQSALSLAVDNAVRSGVVVAAAAGNGGPGYQTVSAPGDAALALTVGALSSPNAVAEFSSRGPTADGRVKPDVMAPGTDIVSTAMGGGFVSQSGTSMATPHVAGVVALLLEAHPEAPPALVTEALRTTAMPLSGYDGNIQGRGRVDGDAAAHEVEQTLAAASAVTNPGDQVDYTYSLVNLGNTVDRFLMGFEAEELPAASRAYPPAVEESWLRLPASSAELAPGEQTGDAAEFAVPEDWAGMEAATYRFRLSATSTGEPDVADTELAFLTVASTKRSKIEYARLELQWLRAEVETTPKPRSLLAKLDGVQDKVERALEELVAGDLIATQTSLDAAINKLEAFLHAVDAQLEGADAASLRETASTLIAHLLEARRTEVE